MPDLCMKRVSQTALSRNTLIYQVFGMHDLILTLTVTWPVHSTHMLLHSTQLSMGFRWWWWWCTPSHLNVAERRKGGGCFRGLLEEGTDTPGKDMTEPEGSRYAVYSTAQPVFHVWVGRWHLHCLWPECLGSLERQKSAVWMLRHTRFPYLHPLVFALMWAWY